MHHRIHVPEITPSLEVSGDEFHHAVRVVRLRQGEEIEVFDGKGRAAHGKVMEIGSRSLLLEIDREIESREPLVRIHLAAAIIQPDKFELVLQKATELGAASITPLVTDRVELRPERYRGKGDRWGKIVFEAVKQCGRAVIPPVNEPTSFDELLKKPGTKAFFDADEEPDGTMQREGEVTVMIGPEGGWSEREIAAARAGHCIFQRLGRRRLRAETAAIAALSIIAARLGDI